MRTDEIRARAEATQNPIRYYVGGEPYVKIGNVELRNHPAVEKLAEYDRMEKHILPKLRSEIDRLTAERDAAISDLEQYTGCQVCGSAKCYKRNGQENCKYEWRGWEELK